MTTQPPRAGWWWLLPLVLAVVSMLPALSGELVWDDVFWKRQVAWFTSLETVLHPPPGIPDWPAGYFRPTSTASWLLDLWLWGPDGVAGRHLSNIVFHAASSVLLYLLALRVLAGTAAARAGALFAAALFATHPIHTESVCWIGARVDVIATLFLLLSMVGALAWRDGRSVAGLLVAPVALLLGLGAKEVAVAGLVLLPLVLALAPRPAGARGHPAADWLPLLVPAAAAAVAWALLRSAGAESVAPRFDGLDPLKLLRAVAWYLAKLVWPWPQLNFAGWEQTPAWPAALAIVGVAVALAVAAVLRWRRHGEPGALVGLLWLGAGLAPSLVVALSSFATNPVAERYLYLPSAGFALACGAALAAVPAGRTALLAQRAAAVLTGLLLAACVVRAFDWTSNVRLWSTATRPDVVQAQPWVELGIAHYKAGNGAAALAAFDAARTRRIDPGTLGVAEYHAGLVHLKARDWAQAVAAFERARAADPANALARYGLGRTFYENALAVDSGDERLALLGRAQVAFLGAIGLDPGLGEARLQLVRVFLRRGDVLAARGERDKAATAWRAGRNQLDVVLRAIPSLAADPGVAPLAEELHARGH